jgi:Protein of unknown function (DUF3303)
MIFMVVETFKNSDLIDVRDRFLTQGRLMPEGLTYVNSWMTTDGVQCYQVMDAPSRELLDIWIGNWQDLVDFEVISVESSKDFWNRFNGRL